jgi:beta-N-acetylhexosaminidase
VLIALGNPYLAAEFPEVQNYLCTFSNAPVSEMSAVKALFGEIPIRGRLPVTIPGIAARGAGVDRTVPAQGGRP